MRNAVHPTIPHGTLPKSAQQRKREYPSATEDSKPGEGDGSPQWIVNMWAMMWGSKRPTPGEVDYDCFLLCLSIIILLLLCVFDPPELSCSFCTSSSFLFSCCFSKQFSNSWSLPWCGCIVLFVLIFLDREYLNFSVPFSLSDSLCCSFSFNLSF